MLKWVWVNKKSFYCSALNFLETQRSYFKRLEDDSQCILRCEVVSMERLVQMLREKICMLENDRCSNSLSYSKSYASHSDTKSYYSTCTEKLRKKKTH